MEESEPNPAGRRRRAIAGAILVALAVFLYGLRADRYHFVGDDGGITLRYAERLADGAGFGYDDGQSVNGCSDPLYTLALAGALASGLDPAGAVGLLGAAGLAVALALVFWTLASRWSLLSAVFAVLAALAFEHPFAMAFNGLEVPFVWLLAALLFATLHARREWVPGIALGLLVANKLDAALAAVAFALVFVALRRSFPWRAALVAVLAAAPVAIVLLASFGTVIPNSMVAKLTAVPSAAPFEPLWMHDQLMHQVRWLYVPALLSLLLLVPRGPWRSLPVATLQVWLVLHLIVYATVDLGAPFPWYAAVPHVLSVILSAVVVDALARATRGAPDSGEGEVRGRSPGWALGHAPRARVALVAVLAIGALAARKGPAIARRLQPVGAAHGLPLYAADDLARQSAGVWLRQHAGPDEVLVAAYGLPAFEWGGPFHDAVGLSSRPDEQRVTTAAYRMIGPELPGDPLRWRDGERRLVATFVADAAAHRFSLLALDGSRVARSGARHLVLPPPATSVVRARDGEDVPERGEPPIALGPGDRAELRFTASAAPTLTFRARWSTPAPPGRTLGDGPRLTVRVDGDDVLYTVVGDGEWIELPGEPVAPGAPPVERRISIVRDAEGEDGAPARVSIEAIGLRVGASLDPDRFELISPRRANRLRALASTGIPHAWVAR